MLSITDMRYYANSNNFTYTQAMNEPVSFV